LLAHRSPGLDERCARGHALSDQLDAREHRVTLVEVVGVDVDAELAQRAYSADTEENLLRHAAVEGGIVEAMRDPRVARGDGLQQEEGRVPPSLGAPHARLDLPGGNTDAYPYPRVLQEIGAVCRELRHRQAVLADALPGVAARPPEADADHRQAQIVRRLHEIAGEDAEAPGVDRKILGEAELHATVGDGSGHGVATRERNDGQEATSVKRARRRAGARYRRGGDTPRRLPRRDRHRPPPPA